jgi:hypothetical protein
MKPLPFDPNSMMSRQASGLPKVQWFAQLAGSDHASESTLFASYFEYHKNALIRQQKEEYCQVVTTDPKSKY